MSFPIYTTTRPLGDVPTGTEVQLEHVHADGKCDIMVAGIATDCPWNFLKERPSLPGAGLPRLSKAPNPGVALEMLKGMRQRIAYYNDGTGNPQPGAIPVSAFELAALSAVMDFAARNNFLNNMEAAGQPCPEKADIERVSKSWWQDTFVNAWRE